MTQEMTATITRNKKGKLARQAGVAVSEEHVRATLSVSQQFQNDLKEG